MHSFTTGQLKGANNIFSKALSIVHGDSIFFSIVAYFDDVLVMRSTGEKLAVIIREILYHADKSDIQFKKEKCEIVYPVSQDVLRLFIDALGMYPIQDKEQEIHNGPTPKTKQKYPVYLGFLNFSTSSFLKKSIKWLSHCMVYWTKDVFQKIKNIF